METDTAPVAPAEPLAPVAPAESPVAEAVSPAPDIDASRSSDHAARFLVLLFVVILLALVLIAATGDPYGAGCGGG